MKLNFQIIFGNVNGTQGFEPVNIGSFFDFDRALNQLNFESYQRNGLYRLIGGIYCLVNIKFVSAQDSNEQCYISEESKSIMELASILLSLDQGCLVHTLTTRKIKPRGENQTEIM